MLATVPSDVDTSEGSFIYDALSPASQELANTEVHLDDALNMVFAQSAAANGYSAQLVLRCSEFGVIPKAGTFATGQVTFSGVNTTPIPTGTTVQTAGGLLYNTTAPGLISAGVATVNVQAAEIGAAYNVPSATIIQIPTTISGITGVTNSTIASGGTDDETNTALLARFLNRVRTPSTSGNADNYVEWALQVPGIGLAKTFPLWAGSGTVKVTAIDSNMQPLTTDLVTALSTYIESQRPIGATVTYESASALEITITVNVTRDLTHTQAGIQTVLTTAIASYLKSIAFVQNYVSYAVIGSLILTTPGVVDYDTLLINTGTVNVTVGPTQVATVGAVTVYAP